MKIGFCREENGKVSVNALTDNSTLEEFSKQLDEPTEAIALLDFTDRRTESRGDLRQAFEVLRSLMGLHTNNGSFCYAVEEMLEEVFDAGRKYERSLRVETSIS